MDTTHHPPSPSSTPLPFSLSADAKAVTAARCEAEELLELIQRRKERIAEDFYDVGIALRRLSRKRMYAAIGYRTFRQLLIARRVMSKTSATKLITIVDAMSRERAVSLGAERAFAVARLIARAEEGTTVDEILARRVSIDGNDAVVGELSVRQISRIAAGAVPPKVLKPKERDARNAARRVQWALRKAGVDGATARAFRRNGTWHLNVDLSVQVVETLLARFQS
jgi:hypothetical protein